MEQLPNPNHIVHTPSPELETAATALKAYFQNIDTRYNLYAWWRERNEELARQDIQDLDGSPLSVDTISAQGQTADQ